MKQSAVNRATKARAKVLTAKEDFIQQREALVSQGYTVLFNQDHLDQCWLALETPEGLRIIELEADWSRGGVRRAEVNLRHEAAHALYPFIREVS